MPFPYTGASGGPTRFLGTSDSGPHLRPSHPQMISARATVTLHRPIRLTANSDLPGEISLPLVEQNRLLGPPAVFPHPSMVLLCPPS